jgi:hypothetical protein
MEKVLVIPVKFVRTQACRVTVPGLISSVSL